jgi:hypothetical protein
MRIVPLHEYPVTRLNVSKLQPGSMAVVFDRRLHFILSRLEGVGFIITFHDRKWDSSTLSDNQIRILLRQKSEINAREAEEIATKALKDFYGHGLEKVKLAGSITRQIEFAPYVFDPPPPGKTRETTYSLPMFTTAWFLNTIPRSGSPLIKIEVSGINKKVVRISGLVHEAFAFDVRSFWPEVGDP